jgi:hypothetical protein
MANLVVASFLVAFLGDLAGKLLNRVFLQSSRYVILLPMIAIAALSQMIPKLLRFLHFHPQTVSLAKDVFGPFVWAPQGPLMKRMSGFFSSLTGI